MCVCPAPALQGNHTSASDASLQLRGRIPHQTWKKKIHKNKFSINGEISYNSSWEVRRTSDIEAGFSSNTATNSVCPFLLRKERHSTWSLSWSFRKNLVGRWMAWCSSSFPLTYLCNQCKKKKKFHWEIHYFWLNIILILPPEPFLAINGLCWCIGPPQVARSAAIPEEWSEGKAVKRTWHLARWLVRSGVYHASLLWRPVLN